MTHGKTSLALLGFCAALPLLATAAPADPEAWVVESRALADQLTVQLKAELQQAMQAAGPVAAIEVCRTRAPEIAARLGRESGAQVGRTALRVRNPANAPDDLERQVLQQFAEQLASAPAAPASPPEAVFELRTPRGVEHRYLRAIPMQPLCVTCHGKTIAPDIAAAIRTAYPEDAATGFEPGELRGAVTVRWPVAN
ncbi:MAG TPA: DUF3365 domain-containing protein [Steroidobacteraceae bacterium]